MPLLQHDIRFAKSANMADVPEGGGPPAAALLVSGRSNELLNDISEETRTTGRTEIVQFHSVLLNGDQAPLLGANVIIADPPADENVSIAMLSLKNPFATRAEIAKRIEGGMADAAEFNGYLLGNHFATMRSAQIFQREGAALPALGKTFVLIYNEGMPGERRQRVRIKTASSEVRTFTQIVNGTLTDFKAQLVTCELFDALLYDFPGSEPSRLFARESNKTKIRETVYNDAGLFYSATRLADPCAINDTWLQLDSIYTRIVPNSRTEAASVDQRPASRHSLVLAESPRRVEVGITPHTQRIRIDEVNATLTQVFQLTPLPAPGTLVIDYWSLGNRYTLTDDGEGKLVGSGGGAVSYTTGAGTLTLKAIPDIGSLITISHGEPTAYTNRSTQGAAVRAPEYCWVIEDESDAARVVPGSLTIGYTSAGVVRTVTDDGAGKLAGAATGVIDYFSRTVLLRPTHMPDAGAQLQIDCQTETLVTEIMAAPTPDAAGFIALSLASVPAAGTLQIQWATAREVSNSSGGNLTTTTASKTADVTYTIRTVPEYYEPAASTGTGGTYVNWPRSS
ncbi:hypothetical protein [Ottowia oryzae]|uniref:Uncharacterized protein n=1 Tax=Ottowia oryzae TaxID=2109914 RepID=A0A2S0MB81_9BURK|nr:hypothetical protein [Ottowia oryzae]AVO33051.1 hypothetical protein C6570_01350 [Ottowia oryzae]